MYTYPWAPAWIYAIEVCVYGCMLLRLYVVLLVLRRDESLCVLAAQRCHGLAPDRRMPRAQRCCRVRCDLHPRY